MGKDQGAKHKRHYGEQTRMLDNLENKELDLSLMSDVAVGEME